MRPRGKVFLPGNVYCGHCGARFFSSATRKTHYPRYDERIHVYKCYNRSQHKNRCDGPTTYRAEKVDGIIDELLRGIFERAKDVSERELAKRQVQISSAQYTEKLKQASLPTLKRYINVATSI